MKWLSKTLEQVVILVLWFVICVCDLDVRNSGFTPSQVRPKPLWNATYVDKLKQDLLLNYDKFARPSQHYNTTKVTIGLSVLHVEVNEFKSTFNIYSWITLNWNDEKLKWNASDYGDLQEVNFADHEIWQPDVMLYNSALGSASNHLTGTNCVVKASGEVLWVPSAQLIALCDLNLLYWPFDTQSCTLKFGSWTYDGTEIDLEIPPTPISLDFAILNGEWNVTSTNASKNIVFYACCDEPYVDASFQFTLTRRSPAYRAIIIVPAFVIIVLTLLGFWLPPQAGEKIMLNCCTTVIICIFLVYFTQKIPAMGSSTPLIVLFYSSSLYVVCFSMVISVIVIWISRTEHNRPLPVLVKNLLTGVCGKVLGLNHYISQASRSSDRATAEEMRDHQVTELEDHTNDDCQFICSTGKVSVQHDWILLAAAIDRMAFAFYGFFFAILSIVYSI